MSNVVNLGSKRSDLKEDASAWSPEECLMEVLERVKKGGDLEETDTVIVILRSSETTPPQTNWFCASPSPDKTISAITRAHWKIMRALMD